MQRSPWNNFPDFCCVSLLCFPLWLPRQQGILPPPHPLLYARVPPLSFKHQASTTVYIRFQQHGTNNARALAPLSKRHRLRPEDPGPTIPRSRAHLRPIFRAALRTHLHLTPRRCGRATPQLPAAAAAAIQKAQARGATSTGAASTVSSSASAAAIIRVSTAAPSSSSSSAACRV
jgi:hypothetical protein